MTDPSPKHETTKLDTIRERMGDQALVPRALVDELFAEAERLAATSDVPAPCQMTHTPPFDFAQCETHDTTFPLGAACRFHGRTSVAEVYAEEADQMRARAVLAEGEAERLRDACKTLGGVIGRQCTDIAKITRSEHLVADDGDADWGAIWDRGFELADRAEKAEAEVARLREKIDVDRAMHEAFRPEVVAEVAVLVCDEMDWQAVADWCGGTIGSAQDPSGEYTSSIAIPGVGEAYQGMWIVQRHDLTFAIRATLEGPSAESVARLTARPAPAWDEEAARAASQVLYERLTRIPEFARLDSHVQSDYSNTLARAVLAVVRDRLPVKPGRETVRLAQHRALMPQAMSIFAAVGGTQAAYDALLDTLADAVLDLLPGRSEVEVKREGIREAADAWHAENQGTRPGPYRFLWSYADRLAAEGGDDRG